eukprot:m.484483 g.484483  ORF g.484483 m.484483 type:complete len:153 (-) comp57202_c0_seq8:605-1063(-)
MHRLVPTAREPDSPRLSVVVPGKDELEEFLELLELTKYAHHFRREDIDFETLLTMDENDLKSIGIDLFGPRRKISSAIKQIVQQRASNTSQPPSPQKGPEFAEPKVAALTTEVTRLTESLSKVHWCWAFRTDLSAANFLVPWPSRSSPTRKS